MLIFSSQNLVFLAVPKTGTTAIEAALHRKADIILTKGRKHIPARRYEAKIAPFLANTFGLRPDRMAVMRDPEDQLGSWYRYRSGPRLKGSPKSTAHLSFDAFVRGVISDAPPPYAELGSQFRFLTSGEGEVLVHHLFAYERQRDLKRFLEDRFEDRLNFPIKNVSPLAPLELEPKTRAALHTVRSAEFALYDRLMDQGGRLDFAQHSA